jgi:hypothetical protein
VLSESVLFDGPFTEVFLSVGAVVGSGAAIGLLIGAFGEAIAARQKRTNLERYAAAASMGAVLSGTATLCVAVLEELVVT